MCGIVGYIGKQKDVRSALDSLKRLEYRGYDSAGLAAFIPERKEILWKRALGRIQELERSLEGVSAQGSPILLHTRWSTHGAPTEANAHPHADCKENIFVVHNGIIENYRQLKEKLLAKGHRFLSETDTEVLPHLIEHFFSASARIAANRQGNLEEAVRKALALVQGSYGIAVIAKDDPKKIVAARLSSPLVISVNDSGGFVASDPAALLSYSNKMVFLDDGEIAVITPQEFRVSDLKNNLKEKEVTELAWTAEEAQKGAKKTVRLSITPPTCLYNFY